MFKRILAATADPLKCDESALSGCRIAHQHNAKLFLLHVTESSSPIYRNHVRHYQTGEEIMCDDAYRKELKDNIHNECELYLPSQEQLDIRIVSGFPWMEILKWSRAESVDLIVLGRHKRKNVEQRMGGAGSAVGSTAEGVIRHERCPVMIVGRPIPEHQSAFKKILLGIDFSASCQAALQFAVNLAKQQRSQLLLFHMIPVPPQPEYSQADYERDLKNTDRKLKALYQGIDGGTAIETIAWGGVFPDAEILKAAGQYDVNLVVLGSHTKIKGKGEKARWYVGRAVERVAAKSPCPVAVITDPSVLKPWEE